MDTDTSSKRTAKLVPQAARVRLRYVSWRARRDVRDAILACGAAEMKTVRADVAARFLDGDGIEIGALDLPLPMPRCARVHYVDYLDADGLESAYRQQLRKGLALVRPDVVDDGARLVRFADESLDFVVANHMLEHVEDPIAALSHQLRVLRPGGVLYLALPHARRTFDVTRRLTSVEHLVRDHSDGAQASRRQHYEECAHAIEGRQGADVAARADEMEAEDLRPHFHVWEPLTFASFLGVTKLPFSLALLQESGSEFIVVLRKL